MTIIYLFHQSSSCAAQAFIYFSSIGVLEILLFNRLGRRHEVLEMLLLNRLGGGKFSENAPLLSKIDESSKLLRRAALLDRHPDGVLEMLLFNRLGRRDGVLV